MSDSDVQLNLRVPKHLRDSVARAAKKNRRSTTAEVIVRLEESLLRDGVNPDTGLPASQKDLATVMESLASRLDVVKELMDAQAKSSKNAD